MSDPDPLFPKAGPRIRIHYFGKWYPSPDPLFIHYTKICIPGSVSGSTSNWDGSATLLLMLRIVDKTNGWTMESSWSNKQAVLVFWQLAIVSWDGFTFVAWYSYHLEVDCTHLYTWNARFLVPKPRPTHPHQQTSLKEQL